MNVKAHKLNGFGKEEHLYLDKEVEVLFGTGRRAMAYPFRALFVSRPYDGVAVKLMVQVPKRRLRHAVRRNVVKRRVREAYRTQKQELCAQVADRGLTLHVAVIYVGDATPPSYADTQRSVRRLLTAIQQGVQTEHPDVSCSPRVIEP